MKSKEDEIEYRESNMPPRGAPGEEDGGGGQGPGTGPPTPSRVPLDESMDSTAGDRDRDGNVHHVADGQMGHTPPGRRRGGSNSGGLGLNGGEGDDSPEYDRHRRAGHTPMGGNSVVDMNDENLRDMNEHDNGSPTDDHSLSHHGDMYDVHDLSDHEHDQDVLPPMTADDMTGSGGTGGGGYIHSFPTLDVDVDTDADNHGNNGAGTGTGTGGLRFNLNTPHDNHGIGSVNGSGLPSGGMKKDKSNKTARVNRKPSGGVRFPDDGSDTEAPPTAPTRTARFADDGNTNDTDTGLGLGPVPEAPSPMGKQKQKSSGFGSGSGLEEEVRKNKLSKLFDDEPELEEGGANDAGEGGDGSGGTGTSEGVEDPLLRTSSSMFDID